MRTTADHAGDHPEDWKAPGAALVRSAATDRIPALADLGRVHIMGIAGSGMSALAHILFDRGLPVSGCEARESITVAGLRALGADVVIGHSPRHLDDTDTFVFTTAINPRHEELVAARESGSWSCDEGTGASAFATRSLTIAALIVAGGFLGSRLLGLLRSVIFANTFGTQPELDAYWVAFRLPDLVFQLLAGATLASAFIPTFAGIRARDGEAAAWRLASSVLNLVLLATGVFAIAAFLLAPVLVPLMAPGLGEDTGRQQELTDLAVKLTRIMLVSPVLFAISGMFMGILNARHHFLTTGLAPMLYNLAIIVAALVSHDVNALAAGVVAGAALHLAVQLPDLRLAGMAYHLVADWRDRAVREVGRLMAPRVLGLAAAQVNFYFIGIFFASTLATGAISALSFAWLIVMTPLGLIGMAISTAAFPTLAEQAAQRDAAMAPTLRSALRLIVFLSLPSGIGLALLAKPVVVVLLQRGEFDAASTDLTANALLFYAPALVAHAAIEILSRGFYVQSDTRTPVTFAVVAMVVNLCLAELLVGPWELEGVALALSVATTLEALLLFYRLAGRMPELLSDGLPVALLRMVNAAGLMVIAVVGVLLVLENVVGLENDRGFEALAIVALCAIAGAATYAAAASVMGLEEPRMLLRRARAVLPGG